MKVKVKVTQSCLTLYDPMDYTVHGILRARILDWVAISSPRDLPNPGIKSRSPTLEVDSLPTELSGKPKLGNTSPLFEAFIITSVFLSCSQCNLIGCIYLHCLFAGTHFYINLILPFIFQKASHQQILLEIQST